MKTLKNYKHVWIVPIYGLLYIMAFSYLEKRDVSHINIIHLKIDDYIPFCEYFIVPYLLWFAFIAVTVLYFAFLNKDKKEYYRLISSLGVGMTLFLLISFLYPNGQDLRPSVFARDNIFVDLVKHLYTIDTSTNILPSIHVFNSVAVSTAIMTSVSLKKHQIIRYASLILTILIVLATMFLKQHTIVDVFAAFILNIVCYQIFYKVNTSPHTESATS